MNSTYGKKTEREGRGGSEKKGIDRPGPERRKKRRIEETESGCDRIRCSVVLFDHRCPGPPFFQPAGIIRRLPVSRGTASLKQSLLMSLNGNRFGIHGTNSVELFLSHPFNRVGRASSCVVN